MLLIYLKYWNFFHLHFLVMWFLLAISRRLIEAGRVVKAAWLRFWFSLLEERSRTRRFLRSWNNFGAKWSMALPERFNSLKWEILPRYDLSTLWVNSIEIMSTCKWLNLLLCFTYNFALSKNYNTGVTNEICQCSF